MFEPKPFSCAGTAFTDTAQMAAAALQADLFTSPVDICAVNGRFTHCNVFFQWSANRGDADDNNWDGVKLSLWARTSGGIMAPVDSFLVGATGMSTSFGGTLGVTVVARAGLVLAAQNILCDGFTVRGQFTSAGQSFSAGLVSLEAWAQGAYPPGVA